MGHIDLFCANAGVGVGGGLDSSLDLWDLNMAVNVMGPVHAARAVIPHMDPGRRRRIADDHGFSGWADHRAGVVQLRGVQACRDRRGGVAGDQPRSADQGQLPVPDIVDTPMIGHFGAGMAEPLTVGEVVDAAVEGLADERS